MGRRRCLGSTLGSGVLVYCLIWGVLVWVRSLELGLLLLLLRGLVLILIARLMRAVRLRVPIKRRRLGRMLILSGRRISTPLARI